MSPLWPKKASPVPGDWELTVPSPCSHALSDPIEEWTKITIIPVANPIQDEITQVVAPLRPISQEIAQIIARSEPIQDEVAQVAAPLQPVPQEIAQIIARGEPIQDEVTQVVAPFHPVP